MTNLEQRKYLNEFIAIQEMEQQRSIEEIRRLQFDYTKLCYSIKCSKQQLSKLIKEEENANL